MSVQDKFQLTEFKKIAAECGFMFLGNHKDGNGFINRVTVAIKGKVLYAQCEILFADDHTELAFHKVLIEDEKQPYKGLFNLINKKS